MRDLERLREKVATERKQLDAQIADREDRIRKAEVDPTDCFVSSWAADLNARLLDAQQEILDNDGMAEFPRLFTLEGEDTGAELKQTRYGQAWLLPNGQWVGWRSDVTLARKGYKIGQAKRPAWARMAGRGKGLSGSAWVEVYELKKESE